MKKIAPPDARDGVYTISPSDAAALLGKMKKNRPLSETDAQAIASDIIANKWIRNGETIIMNGDGTPIDGQHRLRACVLANKPIETYVVWGFGGNPSEFDSLDQGKIRTGAHRLALDGVQNYSMQASVARTAIRYDYMLKRDNRTLPANARIRSHEVRAMRNALAPGIDESCSLVAGLQKTLRGLIPISIAAFVHVKAAHADKERADEFLRLLATGEGLSKSSPVLVLRNNLIARMTNQTRPNSDVLLAITIRSWNSYVSGRTTKIVKWDTEREQFPRFGGKS